MRADALAPRVVLVLLGGSWLGGHIAAADPIPVNFDIQYQRNETFGVTREYWSRNMDLSYARRLSSSLQLSSQLRINSVDYIGGFEKSITPFGGIQLAHTFGGFTASYRPTEWTNTADITTRQKEAQVTGFVAPPRLPRLDVEWIRRHQESGQFIPAGTGTTRSANLTWALDRFELRGGVGDIVLDGSDTQTRLVSQRHWDTGIGYRRSGARWSLHTEADLGDVQRVAEGAALDRNRTFGGLIEYSQRLTRTMDVNLNYTYRNIETTAGRAGQTYATNDGSATWNLRPTRTTQLQVGGGVRPVTLESGAVRTLGYVLGSATAQGRVRAGWTGIASVTEALNRRPDGHAYAVGSYRAGSRFLLVRGLTLDVDETVTDNADTTVRDVRTRTVGTVGVIANPLRRLTFMWNLRSYRSGPDLFHSSAHANTRTFDLRWGIMNGFDLNANLTRSGTLPTGDPTLTTRRLGLLLAPSPRFQGDLQYSRSSESRFVSGTGKLPSREVWSTRVLTGLGRRFRVSMGGSLSDPGTPKRTRQFDVTFSARLGGPS
jgi:hypothetical protein